MKVLVIGSGGREHAIAWKLAQSSEVARVFCAPGSDGMSDVAERVAISGDDTEGLASWALENDIDLTVVGPEAPLCAGLVDRFREQGLAVIGPDSAGARLEGSKSFAKAFMTRYGIPTAASAEFTDTEAALDYLQAQSIPVVVKADGLAAGKGVTVAQSLDEAVAAVKECLQENRFGAAGNKVVIEECLVGQEASLIALVDGQTILGLLPAQDHKPVGEGDTGPNTGGMGAYAPTPLVDDALLAEIEKTVLRPSLEGIRSEGWDYRGFLYAGLMLTEQGPKVLEFNCRMGDPEAQVILPALETDFGLLLKACHDRTLDAIQLRWKGAVVVTVVLASGGYPGSYEKGKPISGLEDVAGLEDTVVFHAGTSRDEQGIWRTAGGRVLGLTAWAPSLQAAQSRAYSAVSKIHFDGMHFRNDIGDKALSQS
jgi:phosphoribosylamine--glycine ligase